MTLSPVSFALPAQPHLAHCAFVFHLSPRYTLPIRALCVRSARSVPEAEASKPKQQRAKPDAAALAAKHGGLPRAADLKIGGPGPDGKVLETQSDLKRARAWLAEANKAHKAGLPIPVFGNAAAAAPAAAATPKDAAPPTGSLQPVAPTSGGVTVLGHGGVSLFASPASSAPSLDASVSASTATSTSSKSSTATGGKSGSVLGLAQLPAAKQVPLFAHLPQPDEDELLGLKFGLGRESLHPAFRALGLRYATGELSGATARLGGFVRALHAFLEDFAPEAAAGSFSGAVLRALRPVLRFLKECRPLLLPLDTLMRSLRAFAAKPAVAALPAAEARRRLSDWAVRYLETHIMDLTQDLAVAAAGLIKDGDVVLTYAHSSAVEAALLHRFSEGARFSVIVVDARPRLEGLRLTQRLAAAGVECDYADVTALAYVIRGATKVLLGAHAMLCNGSALARTGTALVAMHAKSNNVPVVFCCQSFKFTDAVQLDAICSNDLAQPAELVAPSVLGASFVPAGDEAAAAKNAVAQDPFSPALALLPLSAATPLAAEVKRAKDAAAARESAIASANAAFAAASSSTSASSTGRGAGRGAGGKGGREAKDSASMVALQLSDWRELDGLKLLNMNYDVTPAGLITAVVTESRIPVPTTSAPAILREFLTNVDRAMPE